jgi:energy-coupling factor transporter ATP-binding protein EcfA2
VIEIQNLSYSYPKSKHPALVDINTSINGGEFILLAGPSGAGKSTLLRALNGLVPHYSGGTIKGSVTVNGLDVFAEGPKKMSSVVGFVFQDPESQNVLDVVEEELAFGLENAAVPPEEMHRRIDEVLGILELSEMRDRQISSLSGGERQRLAVASVLVMRPKVIALDEPTSQLDPQSAADLLRFLVRLNSEWGMTIVMVEHRLERVAQFSDRILYLDDGQLILDEPIKAGLSQLDPEVSPPLARLWHIMGWDSMPLTTIEGAEYSTVLGLSVPVTEKNKPDEDDPPLEVLLTTHNLHFAYSDEELLKGIDLELRSGETVGLLGRNGTGKSTFLKCLVGLLKPVSGDIRVRDVSIIGRDVADICQEIAFLPQNPDDLLFADSVIEELHITLENHNLHPDQLSRAPSELLANLDLTPYAETYPRDLSVGQRQRVALGAVIVQEPKIVLLDEPTRGLDYLAKHKLMEMWRRWKREGIGLLLVTHDVELVARACDRVLILDQGTIVADGPTSEILDHDPIFKPQLARLFPGYGWLTVNDARDGISDQVQ